MKHLIFLGFIALAGVVPAIAADVGVKMVGTIETIATRVMAVAITAEAKIETAIKVVDQPQMLSQVVLR